MKICKHPKMERKLLRKIREEDKIKRKVLESWIINSTDYTYTPHPREIKNWAIGRDELRTVGIEIDGTKAIKYIGD